MDIYEQFDMVKYCCKIEMAKFDGIKDSRCWCCIRLPFHITNFFDIEVSIDKDICEEVICRANSMEFKLNNIVCSNTKACYKINDSSRPFAILDIESIFIRFESIRECCNVNIRLSTRNIKYEDLVNIWGKNNVCMIYAVDEKSYIIREYSLDERNGKKICISV